MKLTVISFFIFLTLSHSVDGQSSDAKIIEAIEDFTQKWDSESEHIKTYNGMREYCRSRQHRVNTIELVRSIHHYDSVLYGIVKNKLDVSDNAEAEATLRDIQKLEQDYTTKGFLDFLHKECSTFNDIENNYGRSRGKKYDKEVEKMEKELSKYVNEVTNQIDIINIHVHHLQGLD